METSGVLLPPASLIGRAARNAVPSWKSVTTSIPVSLVNCGKSGVIAFDQGWVAPPSVIVWPENCFQSIAALAYMAAASSAKLHRGNIAMPDRAAPAAPNPLTKVRRLAGTRPFNDFSHGAMSVLLCGQSIATPQTGCPRETTERTPEAAQPARLRKSGLPVALMRTCPCPLLFYHCPGVRTRRRAGRPRLHSHNPNPTPPLPLLPAST